MISAAKFLMPIKFKSARILFAIVKCMLLNAGKSAAGKLEEQLAKPLHERKQVPTTQEPLQQWANNLAYREVELAKCLQ